MKEHERRRSREKKWSAVRRVVLCCAALACGQALAAGSRTAASGDPPRTAIHPRLTCSANFVLAPYRLVRESASGGGPVAMGLSPQHQPFNEPPARLRLLNDDPEYNRKSSPWAVALRVVAANTTVWAFDRIVLNHPYSRVGPGSWKTNLQAGFAWDTDRLGMNFFFHPYSGGIYFNSARANGFGYFASVPFVFMGSLLWEFLGETSRPAYNDVINTTCSGALFGEILYRLSSNILNDRATGANRFFREFAAALLNPGRAFGRLLHGKLTRVTPREVYQKEPLNITLATGAHWFNHGMKFGTGSASAIFNVHLDYGDPFAIRPRKPFDFFKMRIDLSYGKNVSKKYLDNLTGYGLWFGRTVHSGNLDMLIGAFQHYDYWDSNIFELSSLGFGGGIIARWRLPRGSNLQTALHLGIAPLGASDSPHVDIVEEGVHLRDYDYSGGLEGKFEGTLNLGKIGQVTAIYHIYGLHTIIGPAGNKIVSVFKPRIAIRLFGDLSLGFEYLSYHKDSYLRDHPDIHASNSEQKIFLMLYF